MVWWSGEWRWFKYVKCTTRDRYIKIGRMLVGWWVNYYEDGKEIEPVTPL